MSVETTPIGPFAGMNNRLPDHQLGITERGQRAGDYLRNAVNVDLTDAGTLQRRKGSTLVVPGADCHSLWSDEQGAYYVDGSSLKTFPTGALVRNGLTPGRPVSFVRFPNGDVYWTNSVVLERIRDGVSEPAGLPTPDSTPVVHVDSIGALPAGRYQVSITQVADDGEQSGATWPVAVQIPANTQGALSISGMPSGRKNIYLTAPNGELLFLAATTTAVSYQISSPPALREQLPTLGFRPMPPGHTVRLYNARLLVADKLGLYYSEPYAPTWHNPLRGYIPLAGITLVEPMETGVFIATKDRTYWLSGADISGETNLSEVLPYGAVAGSSARLNNTLGVVWYSSRGLVIGSQDGQVKNLQEATTITEHAARAATLYREQDGMRHVVSSLSGSEATSAAASSYFEAELVRKETML